MTSIPFTAPTVLPVAILNVTYSIVLVAAVGVGTRIWRIVPTPHWFNAAHVHGTREGLATTEANAMVTRELAPHCAAGE